ncbi:MAG: response regulator [Actinomycetales bacterium]|nr:response regulator [Actinomycetales bacterium]
MTVEPALRIVVAEDEAVIRMDLVEMLGEEGYEVVGQAPDGLTALDLVERLQPDVLLADVAMPGLDGIELTREVADRTAVVVITAFGQRDRVEQARDAGAMAYLVKPVDRADLMPAVEMASSGWETLRSLRVRADRAVATAQEAEQRLADRRDVERAKGLVQERLALGEDQAYAWLRQAAMDQRRPLADVARQVIAQEPADGAPG